MSGNSQSKVERSFQTLSSRSNLFENTSKKEFGPSGKKFIQFLFVSGWSPGGTRG